MSDLQHLLTGAVFHAMTSYSLDTMSATAVTPAEFAHERANRTARRLALAGIQLRFPDASDEERSRLLIELLLGEELAERAFDPKGPAREAKIGSVRMFTPATWSRKVEWPMKVTATCPAGTWSGNAGRTGTGAWRGQRSPWPCTSRCHHHFGSCEKPRACCHPAGLKNCVPSQWSEIGNGGLAAMVHR